MENTLGKVKTASLDEVGDNIDKVFKGVINF